MKGHYYPKGDPAVRSWPGVLTTTCKDQPVNFRSAIKGRTHKYTHIFLLMGTCYCLGRSTVLFEVSSCCFCVFYICHLKVSFFFLCALYVKNGWNIYPNCIDNIYTHTNIKHLSLVTEVFLFFEGDESAHLQSLLLHMLRLP